MIIMMICDLQTDQPRPSATNAREPTATLGTTIIVIIIIIIISSIIIKILQVYYTEGSGQGKPMLGKQSDLLSLV